MRRIILTVVIVIVFGSAFALLTSRRVQADANSPIAVAVLVFIAGGLFAAGRRGWL